MKIAVAQLNFHVGNFESNTQKIINKIQDAKILSDVVHSDHCPVKLKLKI